MLQVLQELEAAEVNVGRLNVGRQEVKMPHKGAKLWMPLRVDYIVNLLMMVIFSLFVSGCPYLSLPCRGGGVRVNWL